MANEKELKSLSDQAAQGKKAKELLDNPLLSQWMIARKATLFESFGMTAANDDEGRKLIWLKKQLLDEMEQDLHQFVNDGIIAQETLNEWSKLKGEQ